MKYADGYPEPYTDSESLTLDDGTEFAPGDQFRFPAGNDPITGEDQYGLCYVLRCHTGGAPWVEFFNVSEEARVKHTPTELADGDLTKLEEKWDGDCD